MIDSNKLTFIRFFKIFYLLRVQSYNSWLFCQNNSSEISCFKIFWKFFASHNFLISHIVLNHTSRDPNFLIQWNFFKLSSHFILRFLANRASIKDHNICLFYCLHWRKSTIFQNWFYPGSISIIHLTSERNHRKLHHLWSI